MKNIRRNVDEYASTPQQSTDKTVAFVSYSHLDREWLDVLKVHLKPYTRHHDIVAWHDEKIEIGDNWLDTLLAAVDSSKLAILLVTPNFLASDFIMDTELQRLHARALKKELQLAWIPISHSSYQQTLLKDYQSAWDPKTPLDTYEQPDRTGIFVQICEQLLGK